MALRRIKGRTFEGIIDDGHFQKEILNSNGVRDVLVKLTKQMETEASSAYPDTKTQTEISSSRTRLRGRVIVDPDDTITSFELRNRELKRRSLFRIMNKKRNI